MDGRIAERVRELLRFVAKNNEVEMLAGHVSKDNLQLLVSSSTISSVSKLVQYIKGYSSRKLLMEYKEVNKPLWQPGQPHFDLAKVLWFKSLQNRENTVYTR